jgi:hypothetical protein
MTSRPTGAPTDGSNGKIMSDPSDKIRHLVNWNSADAESIALQLLEKIRDGKKRGMTVGCVTCFVYSEEPDKERYYDAGFSVMPIEFALWAYESIRRKIESAFEGQNHG